jgi:hypothetical protein
VGRPQRELQREELQLGELQQEGPQQEEQQPGPQEGVNLNNSVSIHTQREIAGKGAYNLRSSGETNFTCSSTHDIGSVYTLRALLGQLGIVGNLLCVDGVDDHDLAELAMRACSAVKEHGLRAGDWHVERAHIGLSIFKGNVAAVDTSVHGFTCCVGGGLRDGVVAVAELELHNVAHGGHNGVGHKRVLRATDDYRDDLVLATVGTSWKWRC